MPLRSLSSSLLVWPNRAQIDDAVRRWALHMVNDHPELVQLGYFGSYARGNWGAEAISMSLPWSGQLRSDSIDGHWPGI